MEQMSQSQLLQALQRVLLDPMKDMVARTVVSLVRDWPGPNPWYRYGTIDPDYTSGLPKVTFDGEDDLSVRRYPHLSSYTPAAGDRVRLEADGGSWIIVGKVVSS